MLRSSNEVMRCEIDCPSWTAGLLKFDAVAPHVPAGSAEYFLDTGTGGRCPCRLLLVEGVLLRALLEAWRQPAGTRVDRLGEVRHRAVMCAGALRLRQD